MRKTVLFMILSGFIAVISITGCNLCTKKSAKKELNANFQVLINQVGYDHGKPKRFVVQSAIDMDRQTGQFEVINKKSDKKVFSGELSYWGRVNEGADDDWGFEYWVGDFSSFDVPGDYEIIATINSVSQKSYPFKIDKNVLWKQISPLALSYFHNARNTRENFDFSEKLDIGQEPQEYKLNGVLESDGKYYDVNGSWFEFGTHGGTFLRDATRVMLSILNTVDREPDNQMARNEMTWGSEWWRKIMIHFPDSGKIIGGMGRWHEDNGMIAWFDYPYGLHEYWKFYSMLIYARLYELTGDKGFLERGELMWNYFIGWEETDKIFSLYHNTGRTQESDGVSYNSSWAEPGFNYTRVDDAAFLLGDIGLYNATQNNKYLEHAEKMADNILSQIDNFESYYKHWNNNYSHDNVGALAFFVINFPDHPKSGIIKKHLETWMDLVVKESNTVSPFGIAKKNFIYFESWNPNGVPPDTTRAFFNRSEEGKAINPEYGLGIWQALLIHKIIPKEEYLDHALNHINWIFGVNPRDFCMMKGIGTNVPDIYPGGMLDGCICHGIISDHGFDRPWLGTWINYDLDWRKDEIAGHKIWAQGEALIRGTACFMMGLTLLP